METFRGCSSLSSIDLGQSIQTISNSAFRSCTSLTSLIIPDSVTEIQAAFQFSGLQSITIPSTTTIINDYAFVLEGGTSDLNQVCGIDVSDFPSVLHMNSVDQTTQEQCTSPKCPIGVFKRWCAPLPCPDNFARVNNVCKRCAIGKFSKDGSACRTWAEKNLNFTIPKKIDDIKDLIRNKRQSLLEGDKRLNVRSLLKSIKAAVKNATGRISLPKEDLFLSNPFLDRLKNRNQNISVVYPKNKTRINLTDACLEADIQIRNQSEPYDVMLEEGEISLICNGELPLTKLRMERDAAIHNETNDTYRYSCWENNAWSDEKTILDGELYKCKNETYLVNSHSGVTCEATNPVSSLNSSLVVGTDSCGIIGEGHECLNYTCNENFVLQNEANCSIDGYEPAVCHCPYTEDGLGNCIKSCDDDKTCGLGESCLSYYNCGGFESNMRCVTTTYAKCNSTNCTCVLSSEIPSCLDTDMCGTEAPTEAPTDHY